MPIYEYVCRSCEHETELLQKMSDPPATDCPACGAPALTKLVSAAGFRLAGSGWYETDFKKLADAKKNLLDKDATGKKADEKKAEPAACSPAGCDKPGCAATAAPSA